MKKNSRHEIDAGKIRYHMLGADKLYAPIPFLFVTERMCQEIVAERKLILDSMPPADQARQQKLFERYNPKHSSTAFSAMVRLFSPEAKD